MARRTNPPFGGEEERGILGNFPKDTQTSETPPLFRRLITRRLTRVGRATVVVPSGTLFGDGIYAHRGGSAHRVRPAHRRSPVERRVRAVHEHPDEPAPLRLIRPDDSGLAPRTAAARGAQGLHEDEAASVRGVRRLPRVVEGPEGERARMEDSCAGRPTRVNRTVEAAAGGENAAA